MIFNSPKKLLILIGSVLVAGVAWLLISPMYFSSPKTATQKNESEQADKAKEIEQTPGIPDIERVAENLNIPWEIVFLPNNEMLVTERTGNLLKIGTDKSVIKIEGVQAVGEGGLQGLALHPNFHRNDFLYLYLTAKNNGQLVNQVVRYTLDGNNVIEKTIIIDNIPASKYHDGGRIAFGPDGKLYAATGDAEQPKNAQNMEFLGGKILRLEPDGAVPEDNPFPKSPVYSYGHRNPQGLTWDAEGKLWATEHGRSVPFSGYDELNLIEAGKNYGWPIIQGDETKSGMMPPIINSGADKTWAPAGLLHYSGYLFFTGLRGEAIYKFDPETKQITRHFFQKFGRLRAVVLGPNNFFYISTSNTDGRGTPKSGDDAIIKVNPKIFYEK